MSQQSDKTHLQVHREQLDRFRKIAKTEERTLLIMFKLMIDNWEDKKGARK